ncbi:DEAD/DEAH box helicase family protein [Pseudoalteromonas carrageenovora]|uniref:DEAD/DEAH box helicase n=1 Tax=Pseudoalteromonas TaxID=53246 RepID=UPI001600AF3A|nr:MULTISPECIES: DEAD/DEAH box helicase family protein [Pseudoalteromonas]MBB1450059.1 DEAD/DEAH box helicase family protein [Pseudoalteromonas sp. SG43-1]MCQ8888244.1 DEAD/DEAH box helicase family protein [Pseudoalteromonas carrageenovora]
MKLRQWQAECIKLALAQYQNRNSHFLTLATPGAGKTMMASELASQLLRKNLVDLIICFSPSSIVSQDFKECLQLKTNERFDGLMGSKGRALTYQSLQYLDVYFWQLFNRYRVFVIFDEIHHCAGSNIDNANTWGEKIILNIQDRAQYTLALTGTPWRSDTSPIVLSSYKQPNNKIVCDFVYGLSEAMVDNVCRIPQIVAIDNNNIKVVDDGESKTFNCFKSLLNDSSVSYQELIENEVVIKYLICSAQKKLASIRLKNPDAAGLIVATSVGHAHQISVLMQTYFNEDTVVVTYRESNPAGIIQEFRHANNKWIISVGMVSEGTNIPRLQVCCHLTNIKTEMHFRQVLGRIMRVTSSENQDAIMYILAESKLLEYAYRINQDVPFEADVVKFENMKATVEEHSNHKDLNEVIFNEKNMKPSQALLGFDNFTDAFELPVNSDRSETTDNHFLTGEYERIINISGRFQQEAIALGLSELK